MSLIVVVVVFCFCLVFRFFSLVEREEIGGGGGGGSVCLSPPPSPSVAIAFFMALPRILLAHHNTFKNEWSPITTVDWPSYGREAKSGGDEKRTLNWQ